MEFHYQHENQEHRIQLEPNGDGNYTAFIGDKTYKVEVKRLQSGYMMLLINGKRLHAYTTTSRNTQTGLQKRHVALVDREVRLYELAKPQASNRRKTASAGSGNLTAQMPGQVTQVLVKEGDMVIQGQPLMLLEAMKMEIRLTAPQEGRVTRLFVKQGDTVERGQQLAEVAPE
ncbi:MAG: acetyl-CoA carboxylase biotin carboxyl carrier protein subunit [Chloroflexota bacterium]|nr:acetyl-CoA carboxylase biotin carboxyl carrier protein subunit [Chloroflexota bacterium]NOG64622.1 acetyl-CoA carboxylase biotin carboxyl carrier protein subunit [Chloroflexota bacterium]GIK63378.1 MAG: acetyl-CoA carboxylase biotin carboxyl carrier protein subunit [Chloroflexota bacterium]